MQSNPTINISEASRLTGVAAVTLRAWERRYGLVKPSRTPKGHRFYSDDNIAQIHKIVDWLSRGVKISKVADLLANDSLPAREETTDTVWQEAQDELLENLIALKAQSLNPVLDRLNKSLPFITLCEQVYQPLHQVLMRRWQNKVLGYQLEQQLWQQSWQRQLTIMTLRAEKQKSQASIWLINLDQSDQTLDYWLLYSLLLQANVRVHSINQLNNMAELSRLEGSPQQSFLLYGNNKLSINNIVQLSKYTLSNSQNIFVAGHIVSIHEDVITDYALKNTIENIKTFWQSKSFQAWLVPSELI